MIDEELGCGGMKGAHTDFLFVTSDQELFFYQFYFLGPI
jgi:hypothetical protein